MENPQLSIERIHLKSGIFFEREQQKLGFDAFHLKLNQAVVSINGALLSAPLNGEFQATGAYLIGEKALNVSEWQLEIKDLLGAAGTMSQEQHSSASYRVEIRDGHVFPSAVSKILPKIYQQKILAIQYSTSNKL